MPLENKTALEQAQAESGAGFPLWMNVTAASLLMDIDNTKSSNIL